jgi:hypothetical protein
LKWINLPKEYAESEIEQFEIKNDSVIVYLISAKLFFSMDGKLLEIEKKNVCGHYYSDGKLFILSSANNKLVINKHITSLPSELLPTRDIINLNQIKHSYFFCREKGLIIYDTFLKANYTLLEGVKVTDVASINEHEIMVSTDRHGVYILSDDMIQEQCINSTYEIQNQINNKTQIAVALNNRLLLIYDCNLKLKKTIRHFQHNKFISKTRLWIDSFDAIHATQGIRKVSIAKNFSFSNSLLREIHNYRAFYMHKGDDYGLNIDNIINVNIQKVYQEKERIFGVCNYKSKSDNKDSALLYVTYNGIKAIIDQQIIPINNIRDGNKLICLNHHFYLAMNNGSLIRYNNIFHDKSYTRFNVSNDLEQAQSFIPINDTSLLVSYRNANMLLIDRADTTIFKFFQQNLISGVPANITTIGTNLFLFQDKSITKMPYDYLMRPTLKPTIISANFIFNSTHSNEKKINIDANISEVDCLTELTNLYHLPFILQYNFNGGEWVNAESNLIHFNGLNYGRNTIGIQLVDYFYHVLDSRKIEIFRTIPFFKSMLFYGLFVSISTILLFWLIWFYYQKSEIKKRHQEELRLLALQSEFRALNAMMNPHFVFNALGNIQSLYETGNLQTAKKYLNSFGLLIRKNMKNIAEDLISLEDELEIVKEYLTLECLRLGNSFSWKVSIEEDIDVYEIMVPPLLLQPIIENSIKHGLFKKQESPNSIEIKIFKKEKIIIQLLDNGVGFYAHHKKKDNSNNGMALQNIYLRILRLNQLRKINIEMSNYMLDECACVEIRI